MKVERRIAADLDPVPDELRRFAQEFDDEAQVVIQLDQDHFWGQVRDWLARGIGYLGVIPGVGLAGAVVAPDLFGGHLEAQELFWYVSKEHRGAGSGLALLEDLEDWARSRGARRVSMVALDAVAVDQVCALYRSAGYFPMQRAWSKNL